MHLFLCLSGECTLAYSHWLLVCFLETFVLDIIAFDTTAFDTTVMEGGASVCFIAVLAGLDLEMELLVVLR